MAGVAEMTFTLRVPGWVSWILRLTIAAIFIYAGITKVMTPLRFITDVNNFHLLPWASAVGLAFYLPWLEIICGVALIGWQLDRGAVLILLVLTSMFLVAIASARVRGIDISCGCFGHAAKDLSFASHLALNLGIIAILLMFLRIARPQVRS
jgi:putative oxidoreductase